MPHRKANATDWSGTTFAQKPTQGDIELASYQAENARALTRRNARARREAAPHLRKEPIARLSYPARRRRTMRPVQLAELVDREPVYEVLAEQVLSRGSSADIAAAKASRNAARYTSFM